MEVINFSNNWNNKLTNKAFSTLRLHNPKKYRIGHEYIIKLKGEQIGIAELKQKRVLSQNQLNDFICYLDTGYSLYNTMNIFKRMYKDLNLQVQKFDFCLLVYKKAKT